MFQQGAKAAARQLGRRSFGSKAAAVRSQTLRKVAAPAALSTFSSAATPKFSRRATEERNFLSNVHARSFSTGAQGLSPAAHFGDKLQFHHLHFYVKSLSNLEDYKSLESKLNAFAKSNFEAEGHGIGEGSMKGLAKYPIGKYAFSDVSKSRKHWESVESAPSDPSQWGPAGQDMVKQLIVGAGWRVVSSYEGPETVSYHIATHAKVDQGVAVVVTAPKGGEFSSAAIGEAAGHEENLHFRKGDLSQFLDTHNGREGCGVLAFEVPRASSKDNGSEDPFDAIVKSYETKHPNLMRKNFPKTYENGTRIFEAYAYYLKDHSGELADQGTCIRFVQEGERTAASGTGTDLGVADYPLPGLRPVSQGTEFPVDGAGLVDAFADHWVSNVYDRVQVLQTFEDVLGFESKVNFNAGVVGAGKAVIESTVTGNDAGVNIPQGDLEQFLKSQDQIFLPINNPLSPHGHVAQYLVELGQGVQHLACRVKDLPAFIDRANKYRKVTGEGLAFLNIPRSYYGYLDPATFEKRHQMDSSNIDTMFQLLRDAGITEVGNVVKLDATVEEIEKVCSGVVGFDRAVAETVLQGRYSNMIGLLKDRFTEAEYLRIIDNQILVDVQGHDALLQIFTQPVLMQKAGDQAPFFEFIQRVCDKNATTIKPGCGGFGIRNFLTLFLSIEVSNCMQAQRDALARGDNAEADKMRRAIQIFTHQLNMSNPVLTQMTDAMEAQSDLLDQLNVAAITDAERAGIQAKIDVVEAEKKVVEQKIKDVGELHKEAMDRLMTGDNTPEEGSVVELAGLTIKI